MRPLELALRYSASSSAILCLLASVSGTEKIPMDVLMICKLLTSWNDCRSYQRWLHDLTFLPDSDDNDSVTEGDDEGGHDEEGEGDQAHVQLPVPLGREVYPALSSIVCETLMSQTLLYIFPTWSLMKIEKEQYRDRKGSTERPG